MGSNLGQEDTDVCKQGLLKCKHVQFFTILTKCITVLPTLYHCYAYHFIQKL
jgi:hypothetical protein